MMESKLIETDPRIKTPSNIIVAGPSQSGKSCLISQLLKQKNMIFHPVPKKILWCYALWQPLYDTLKEESIVDEFIEGINGYRDHLPSNGDPCLIVFDDLQREAQNDVAEMFERGGHHENCTLILTLQNLFLKGKQTRNLSLNSHYCFVFKNSRDMSQINHLARQVLPGNTKFIEEAYFKACEAPHSYLMFDFHPESSPELKFRSDILCLADQTNCSCQVFIPNN